MRNCLILLQILIPNMLPTLLLDFGDRQLLQTEYDILSTEEAEKNILCAQHWVYEQSDKTGRLLAHQIRQAEASRMISQIRLQTGIITVNHKEINSQFKQFYIDLYTSESSSDTSQLDFFLNDIKFPTISEMSCDAEGHSKFRNWGIYCLYEIWQGPRA